MAKKKETQEQEVRVQNGIERRSISKELCEILDNIKANVSHYAWDEIKISDAEASKILAKKIKSNGLDKEWLG